jgi:hypothetical protein
LKTEPKDACGAVVALAVEGPRGGDFERVFGGEAFEDEVAIRGYKMGEMG